MSSLCSWLKPMKSWTSRRGEVPCRGSLVAVVTPDRSRALLFLFLSKALPLFYRNCQTQEAQAKDLRVTPLRVTRSRPKQVDFGRGRSQLEGRGQNNPCCGHSTTFHPWLRDKFFLACVFRGLPPILLTLSVTFSSQLFQIGKFWKTSPRKDSFGHDDTWFL